MNDPPRGSHRWILAALDRYEGPLVSYAARLLGDRERARDVVQETFLRLCERGPEALDGHLAEWLFTVCRNRALDVRAKERPMRTIDDERVSEPAGLEPDPARALEERDAVSHVLRALERLPASQREVVRLKFQHGLSYAEISGVTKLSVSNVGFLLHKGMRALRERLAGTANGTDHGRVRDTTSETAS